MPLEGHERRVQAGVDYILSRAGQLKAGNVTVQDKAVKNQQPDLLDYLSMMFAALEKSRTHYRDPLVGFVHGSATPTTDGLRAPVETIEFLSGQFAIGYQFSILSIVLQ